MPTPAGVTIYAEKPDGSRVEITEGVQALYDGVIQSLDWGSGFWTYEDAVPIAKVAEVCGFKQDEEAQRYLRERRREDRRQELIEQGRDWATANEQARSELPDPA